MGAVDKIIAVFTVAIGFLIILDAVGKYTVDLPLDIVLIGAIALVASQIINLILLKVHNGTITSMQIITHIIIIIPAIAYLATYFVTIPYVEQLPLVLGIVLILESLYALH